MDIILHPIGFVRSPRTDRSDDYWGSVESRIEIDERFPTDALLGLEEFSHLEVIFQFHGVDPNDVVTGARHPRDNPTWPRVGIFAQRGSRRPNRLGLSRCALLGVKGRVVHVRGLDAVDGSPVLDLKPYLMAFNINEKTREPAWVDEFMRHYYID
jgi:tRNA-Thr(GGU) m(6)t(6)A37 methyltransferase TsaA